MTSDKMADDLSESACRHDNVTSSSDDSSPFTSVRFVAPVAALAALNLVVIVGNSLVIAAVFTYRNLRTVTNTFVVSLAVSDLMLGAVVLPFSSVNEVLGWWPFGRIWCSAWLAIDVWVCTASILNLCAISLDRYLAISRPFKYPLLMSPSRAKVAVAVVWTLALAICLPPLFGWRERSQVAATTRPPCSVGAVDCNLYHTLKTIGPVTADVNRNPIQSSTTNDQSTFDTNALNIAIHSTDSATAQRRSYSTQLTSSISRRITNVVHSKHGDDFNGNFATTSIVDVATTAVRWKTSGIIRRSGSGEEAKNGESAEWNLVSDRSVDVEPTVASFNACRVATDERPLCMLTSEPGYIIYSACGSFWIPMLVMVFFYLKIYQTAVKATTALNSGVLTCKTTGRITSNSEVAAVNLRVHRGGGGIGRGGGGAVRTSGGYWTSTPNRLRNACNSLSQRTPQYGNNADKNPHKDGNRKLRIRGASSSSAGNFFRRPSSDRTISRNPTVVISGSDADAVDESCRQSATNRSTGCCTWSKSGPRVSSSSQHDSHGKATGASNTVDSSHRRTCSSTATNVESSSRRRCVSKQSSDFADAPVPGEGIECLVQSTLTPIFEQCSASARRSVDGRDNVEELVDTSPAHAGRRFVQIRTQLRRLNREKKAAKTVGVIVGCFVLCWAPFFTVYVLGVFCVECTPPIAFVFFFWLGYCNSAINPFVYALCSKDFRSAFRRLLRCGRGTRHDSNTTIAALVTRFRSQAPRAAIESANAAVSRRLYCQSSMTSSRMTSRC